MSTFESPMGLALLICDSIIEDKLTGKKTLVGLFDRIQANKYPCMHPAMTVFVSLTGGRGHYECEVICRHQDNETVAFSAKGSVTLRDPRKVVDLVFRLNGVRFPKPGIYWLHFLADEIPIMMRQVTVQERKPEKNENGPKKENGA